MTALEISTSKVVQEKIDLERKYKQLKEDYSKLSMVCHDYRTDKSKVENNPSRV